MSHIWRRAAVTGRKAEDGAHGKRECRRCFRVEVADILPRRIRRPGWPAVFADVRVWRPMPGHEGPSVSPCMPSWRRRVRGWR